MATTGTISIGSNIGGVSQSKSIIRTGTGWQHKEEPEAGQAGVLTTRSSTTEGVITAEAHGLETTDLIDIGWVDADGFNKLRSRVTIGSKTDDTITFSGGAGDDLPAQDYAVLVGKRAEVPGIAIPASSLKMLRVCSLPPTGQTASRAVVSFLTSVPAEIAAFDLASSELVIWYDNSAFASPLGTSAVASVEVSSLSANVPEVYIEAIYDASP